MVQLTASAGGATIESRSVERRCPTEAILAAQK